MRKSTKLVLLVAALVALCSIAAYAAGWTLNANGEWTYVDSNGDLVIDDFKKGADGNYYYLGDDGILVTSSIVNHNNAIYYVDGNGKKVVADWVKVPADDDDAELGVEYRYYYFQNSGIAYTDADKKINGKTYHFDADGKMVWGLLDSNHNMLTDESLIGSSAEYWFGEADDGSAQTDWYKYDATDLYEDGAECSYFYFKSGKKIKDQVKAINGVNYNFLSDGRMSTGWGTASSTSAIVDHNYFDENGKWVKKDWRYVYAKGDSEADGDSKSWYYYGSDGNYYLSRVAKIKSKYYAFNSDGTMAPGLVGIDDAAVTSMAGQTISVLATKTTGITIAELDDDDYDTYVAAAKKVVDNGGAVYYFSGDEANDGAAKNGTLKITLDDTEYTFGFDNNYQAYIGYNSKQKKIFTYGILETAGSSKYTVVENVGWTSGTTLTDAADGRRYSVVGTTGTITAPGKIAKDADGNYYAIRTAAVVATVTGNDYYVAEFMDSDYAKSAAEAWAAGKDTFTYNKATLNTSDYVKYAWDNTGKKTIH